MIVLALLLSCRVSDMLQALSMSRSGPQSNSGHKKLLIVGPTLFHIRCRSFHYLQQLIVIPNRLRIDIIISNGDPKHAAPSDDHVLVACPATMCLCVFPSVQAILHAPGGRSQRIASSVDMLLFGDDVLVGAYCSEDQKSPPTPPSSVCFYSAAQPYTRVMEPDGNGSCTCPTYMHKSQTTHGSVIAHVSGARFSQHAGVIRCMVLSKQITRRHVCQPLV
jgi:hypothetical protein